MMRYSVTVPGPSVAGGTAARMSEELEEAVGETVVAATALEAGELEAEVVEDVAAIRNDRF